MLNKHTGQISLQVLIYSAVAVILLTGFILWGDAVINYVSKYEERSQALELAEAGIEYYRWLLAHNPTDYQDGTGQPGPYVHDYFDKNGNLIGQFSLDITPPPIGSTVVIIRSSGKTIPDSGVEKIIEVRLGKPSYAKFAAALNADVRFGPGTEVFGAIHSNGGIRFDGLAHNLVSSALYSYDDPDHTGANEFAVHTHINPIDPLPNPPDLPPNRPDIFMAGRQLSVPALDFPGITQDLSSIREQASSSGFYLGPSGAGKYGYEVVFKTDNTFSVHYVNSLVSPPWRCTNYLSQDGWGTWSINTTSSVGNFPIPDNGLIFLEDNVWARGKIDNSRVTLASAKFPDDSQTRTSITINQDLLYTNYDGSDAIALIAQKNINIGLRSSNIIRVDGALMAQNGRVGRYYYRSYCGAEYERNTITTYGMIASNQRYGFAYTDGTGYENRYLNYDANLMYAPPPSFPLTTDDYQIISWKLIK